MCCSKCIRTLVVVVVVVVVVIIIIITTTTTTTTTTTNKKIKNTFLIDIAVPNTHNLAKTITNKQNKYQELANEICAVWK